MLNMYGFNFMPHGQVPYFQDLGCIKQNKYFFILNLLSFTAADLVLSGDSPK